MRRPMRRPLPHIAIVLAVALAGTAIASTTAEARRGSGLFDGAAGAVRRLTRPPAEQQQAAPPEQPQQRTTPTPGTAGKSGTTQEPATRDLRIVNETGKQIQYLFAVPVSATDWGRDWLGSDVLPDGEEVDAALSTESCRYDLRAQFADGREILRFDVDVCAEGGRLVLDETSATPPTRPGVAFLRVRNALGVTVMTFNVVRAGTRARPADLFGAAVLPNGGVFTLRLAKTEPCLYAIEAGLRSNQGPPVRFADQDLCGGGEFVIRRASVEAAPADGTSKSGARTAAAATRSVEVVNASRRQLMFLYARPAGSRDWNDNDLLGDEVVGPGQRFRIELSEGGCVFDFRARFNSGETDTRLSQDVCREGRLTVGR